MPGSYKNCFNDHIYTKVCILFWYLSLRLIFSYVQQNKYVQVLKKIVLIGPTGKTFYLWQMFYAHLFENNKSCCCAKNLINVNALTIFILFIPCFFFSVIVLVFFRKMHLLTPFTAEVLLGLFIFLCSMLCVGPILKESNC